MPLHRWFVKTFLKSLILYNFNKISYIYIKICIISYIYIEIYKKLYRASLMILGYIYNLFDGFDLAKFPKVPQKKLLKCFEFLAISLNIWIIVHKFGDLRRGLLLKSRFKQDLMRWTAWYRNSRFTDNAIGNYTKRNTFYKENKK